MFRLCVFVLALVALLFQAVNAEDQVKAEADKESLIDIVKPIADVDLPECDPEDTVDIKPIPTRSPGCDCVDCQCVNCDCGEVVAVSAPVVRWSDAGSTSGGSVGSSVMTYSAAPVVESQPVAVSRPVVVSSGPVRVSAPRIRATWNSPLRSVLKTMRGNVSSRSAARAVRVASGSAGN